MDPSQLQNATCWRGELDEGSKKERESMANSLSCVELAAMFGFRSF